MKKKKFFYPFVVVLCIAVIATGLLLYSLHKPCISGTASNVEIVESDPVLMAPAPLLFVEAPSNHPPSVIVIGAFHWHIRYAKMQSDLFAITDTGTLEIVIQPSLRLDQFKETVLHEIMHACIYLGNGGSSPAGKLLDDDQFIEATAPAFLDTMERNPELVRWLQQK